DDQEIAFNLSFTKIDPVVNIAYTMLANASFGNGVRERKKNDSDDEDGSGEEDDDDDADNDDGEGKTEVAASEESVNKDSTKKPKDTTAAVEDRQREDDILRMEADIRRHRPQPGVVMHRLDEHFILTNDKDVYALLCR